MAHGVPFIMVKFQGTPMTQPPYHASEGHPMRRFTVFAIVLFAVVLVGSQPWNGSHPKRSMCVCLPSRAALILRSITGTSATSVSAMTRTQAPSTQH